jgi:hypothetical protein
MFILVMAFVIVSTVFVIAAGILSSRLTRQDEWNETYEVVETVSAETIPQTTE